MEKNEMKKFFIIQYVIIGLLVVLCLFLIIDRCTNNDSSSDNQSEILNNDYDVSMMNEVSVQDILNMFEDGKSYVLYIGRSTCGVCKVILPNLKEAQNDLDYKTQYLDITKADRNSSDWAKLEDLLDKETTLSVTNANGEKELKTETYGYFIGKYGYTPTLIVINNNKMVAGHIGNFELDDLKEWLKTNGIG